MFRITAHPKSALNRYNKEPEAVLDRIEMEHNIVLSDQMTTIEVGSIHLYPTREDPYCEQPVINIYLMANCKLNTMTDFLREVSPSW